MNPLPVARGRLLLAAVTALALSACASSRAPDTTIADVLAIALSPQQPATHVRLAAATIRSIAGAGGGIVRYGDKVVDLQLKPGESRRLGASL